MSIDLAIFKSDELTPEKLTELIIEGKSFKVRNIKNMTMVIQQVEQAIEKLGLKCRVYTEYRSSAMAGALIPTGFTQAIGLVSAVGIGLHNLVTYNPDYEIGKNKIDGSITVTNKKPY